MSTLGFRRIGADTSWSIRLHNPNASHRYNRRRWAALSDTQSLSAPGPLPFVAVLASWFDWAPPGQAITGGADLYWASALTGVALVAATLSRSLRVYICSWPTVRSAGPPGLGSP